MPNAGHVAASSKKRAVRAGDLRHRVPVALVAIGRDEAVGDEQLVGAVVVEVTELRAPRPARVGDRALGDVAEAARLATSRSGAGCCSGRGSRARRCS